MQEFVNAFAVCESFFRVESSRTSRGTKIHHIRARTSALDYIVLVDVFLRDEALVTHGHGHRQSHLMLTVLFVEDRL